MGGCIRDKNTSLLGLSVAHLVLQRVCQPSRSAILQMGDEGQTQGRPGLRTPAPQHHSALLPSDSSVLGDKSHTSTINKAAYLPASQALLPVMKNEASSSFGLADRAVETWKHCVTVQEQ